VEDSWVMLDLESEMMSKGVNGEHCKKPVSQWTGQNWSKYPGETVSSCNTSHQQEEEEKPSWSGQMWNKYV
jgi:hypothetical protein